MAHRGVSQRSAAIRNAAIAVLAGLVFAAHPAAAQPPGVTTAPPADAPPLPPAPPPAPAPAPGPLPIPTPPEVPPPPEPLATEPLAGWSDGTPFLRSPDSLFILFPTGRLQVDTYVFSSANRTPNDSVLLRRARLEAAGWIGTFVYFHMGGDFAAGVPAAADPVAQSNINATDNFVALAPWKNLAILQVGQYDAPFTLENRISEKYVPFMERSIAVRAFGIPENKQIGAMVTGYNERKNFLYSLGVFDGDGQNFRNVDDDFDVMGRAWIAPLTFGGPPGFEEAHVGGSFWTGRRANTLPLPTQTTQAGFTFLGNRFPWVNGGMITPVELHQNGRMQAYAAEVNVPYQHRYGLRWEFIWKDSPLSANNITSMTAPVVLGAMNLEGWATYGEIWWWVLGDDRIVGDSQGIEPFTRFKKFGVRPPQNGLMLALKVEYLDEDLTEAPDAAALGFNAPMVGNTQVTAFELGINYWHSKRFRATFNYVLNHFGGNTAFVGALASRYEQEFLFRLAIAL